MPCGFCGADDEEFTIHHVCEAMIGGEVKSRMPPSDEEYLETARHAMMALEAQLYRSLGGPAPSRDQSLAIAREMRDIVARAIKVLGVDGAQEIVDWYERAGKRVIRDLGTSAWEEPQTVEQAKARMGTLPAAPGPGVLDRVNEREPPPLTDEDLDALAGDKLANTGDSMRFYALGGDQLCLWRCGGRAARLGRERSEDEGHRPHCPIYRLVAEVRRLRSDEWLRAAALEIADKYESGTVSRLASAVTILRKHRDGKA